MFVRCVITDAKAVFVRPLHQPGQEVPPLVERPAIGSLLSRGQRRVDLGKLGSQRHYPAHAADLLALTALLARAFSASPRSPVEMDR